MDVYGKGVGKLGWYGHLLVSDGVPAELGEAQEELRFRLISSKGGWRRRLSSNFQ